MKLIIGLGNPGAAYKNSRHNFGFIVLDKLTQNFKLEKKLEAEIVKQKSIIYAKPQTFMNSSGEAIVKIAKFYKIKPENIIVIYDDKDLPFGTIRIRPKGSSGGHNGLKSIICALGTDNFTRIRLGISNSITAKTDTADFVLSNFSAGEKKQLPEIINQALLEI